MSAGYLDRVRGDIRKLGLDDAVTLTGSVTVDQLIAYHGRATAFLTLSEHEGSCVPLLEAMRSDLLVVVDDASLLAYYRAAMAFVSLSEPPGQAGAGPLANPAAV